MRRDKRYAPPPRGLTVRCGSWGEFVERYASDVSQGGMFIVTDDAPQILSEIDVHLSLPEGHEILLRASVVHVIDPERAAAEGREAGVGVQFVQLDGPRKAQIQQLVEYARWEGASGGASLASRLFEVSTSLPPSKIMDALPPLTPSGAPAIGVTAPPAAASAPPARGASSRAPKSSRRPSRRARHAESAGDENGENAAPSAAEGAEAPAEVAETPPPSLPLDVEKLKLGMTHLAHKRFEQALKVFGELAHDSHADPQPRLWLGLTRARLRLNNNDPAGAAEHYKKVLEVDEGHHEARRFVREYHAKKRLEALPFGRYFIKK